MARRPSDHLTAIVSRRVPRPSGATAQAISVPEPGRTLYLSGQLPREAPKGTMCTGPIRRQMEVLCGNVRFLLADAGFTMEELAQVTVYLTDFKHLPIVDELWRKQFVGQLLPARTLVQVAALEEGALVAVTGVAVKRANPPELPPPPPNDGYDDGMMY